MEDIFIYIYLFFEKFFSLLWIVTLVGGIYSYYETNDLVQFISMMIITIMLLLLKIPKIKNKVLKIDD
jgi:hypothetical protein